MKVYIQPTLKSLLRITVLPIAIYYFIALLTINIIEPIPYKQGCFPNFPEDPASDLLGGAYLILFNIMWTPIVLLNLIGTISKKRILRNIFFLIPSVPVLFGIFIVLYNWYYFGFARPVIYVGLTEISTLLIILWNARDADRRIEKSA
jgi:hypothetical protein